MRPSILISNDDSIFAPGIQVLAEVAAEFGDIMIVAPDAPQSAMGHAISLNKPLRTRPETLANGMKGFSCNGTPADCVKIATGVMMETPPTLVLSGINHGANSSISTIYSGTLAAAREGAIQGIPSIGFSVCNFKHDIDLEASRQIVRRVLSVVLEQGMRAGQMMSVNIPDLPFSEIKGIKICRQARGKWVEEFDSRLDPYGKPYYWLTGKYELQDEGTDTDEYAISQGYVSLMPLTFDFTAHYEMAELNHWRF